ncbi:MAG: hypothetical protein ACTMUB_06500 [cyanobacterium endosymbiont of Rhopalodia musculus]|uniref:hypothetical protein n=1 Tax=cyanobacterium endosymbiont of Epithemia clementina EcSB TaxID=3034674 RepID=UPI00247FF0D8|nr:hypothetical protein [cyanobacterium endosymbiont of Epithemia clementina EcSB]WGT68410.1 hypothetical protein P3F56_01340 [cyanobacterium endosymbiont of Epithemia clementina EcSB]
MEHGLLWLPLLIIFFWLAWSGKNEYQKLEAYRQWAENFDQSKYDIYAIIGVKQKQITWGKPTQSLPKNLPSFSLEDVTGIRLLVNDFPVDINTLPTKGNPTIEFSFTGDKLPIKIPFTEIDLAVKWLNFLENLRQ